MTSDAKLALIRVKVERAKRHMSELEVEVNAFFSQQPYKVEVRRDSERRLVYYLSSVTEPSPAIAVLAGEVIQNLRSALDHLAYQLAVLGTGGKGDYRRIYFPITEDATKYKNERTDKVKGMRLDAIRAIDAIKPYKGGNDVLWRLHKLNNIDKHRLLVTVGSIYKNLNIAPVLQKEFEKLWSDPQFADVRPNLTVPDLLLNPGGNMFPLKAGDDLFTDLPDAEVNEKIEFHFQLVINEPQVIEGAPLLETLKEMIDVVDNTILSFKPLLV